MSWSSIVMSLVEETKLLPDDRDSQTVWVNDLHVPCRDDPGRGQVDAELRELPGDERHAADRVVAPR